jgi:hypothetical protein
VRVDTAAPSLLIPAVPHGAFHHIAGILQIGRVQERQDLFFDQRCVKPARLSIYREAADKVVQIGDPMVIGETHLPALHNESIEQCQKRGVDLLDLSHLTVALLYFPILARDLACNTLRGFLDAPGKVSGLLVHALDLNQVLSLAGAAGLMPLPDLDKGFKRDRGAPVEPALR